MPEILQFGPFMIRFSWLLWAVSGFIGYIVMKYRLKRSGYGDRLVLDILSGGLLIAALVWKFSPALFTPSILWKSPLSILFISGSSESAWFGAAAAAIYVGFKCWKMHGFQWLLPDLLPFGITTMVVVYSLLAWQYGTPTSLPWGISIEDPDFKYHPINVYKIMITVPLFIWLWKRKPGDLGSGKPFADFITFYGIGLLVVSFFEPQTGWMLGMSREQFFFFFLIVSGSILGFRLKKKEDPVEQGADIG